MITAKEAWEKANQQKNIDAYMDFIECSISDSAEKGDMNIGVDFQKTVSSFIRNKIKERLEDNGFNVEVFPAFDEGITYRVSWEIEDGESNT